MRLLIVVLLCLTPIVSEAVESDYSKPWCAIMSGQYQAVTTDGTRVDCLTTTTAWEIEFASHWYEGVGQMFYYATMTNRKPGLVLIVLTADDQKYVDRFVKTMQSWGWIHYIDFTIVRSIPVPKEVVQ